LRMFPLLPSTRGFGLPQTRSRSTIKGHSSRTQTRFRGRRSTASSTVRTDPAGFKAFVLDFMGRGDPA
jgi:hypothetical protein